MGIYGSGSRVGTPPLPPHSLTPTDALAQLSDGWAPFIIDVRQPSEIDIASLPITDRNVPHKQILPSHIPLDGDVLVFCKGGVRSKAAINTLIGGGVDPNRLFDLVGGILQWQSEVDEKLVRY